MSTKVSLTVLHGSLAGTRYGFDEPMLCVIGRSPDCAFPLPQEHARHASWFHCALNVSPPWVSIKDLGSRNGTLLNGINLGVRPFPESLERRKLADAFEFHVFDGDRIQVGELLFEVKIHVPYHCACCAKVIHDRATIERAPGRCLCDACRIRSVQERSRATPDSLCDSGIEFDAFKTARLNDFTRSQFFDGRYRIRTVLGKGGMSLVYRVTNRQTGRDEALKILLPELVAGEHAIEQFLREADYSCRLDHPNIVRSFEYGNFQGTIYLAMEYCNGGTVNSLMRRRGGRLPVAEALRIFSSLLDALEYAHHIELENVRLIDGSTANLTGIVHRDIKPENMFIQVEPDGSYAVKVGDFGLAKAFERAGLTGNTCTGVIMGAMGFISRAQIRNYKYAKPEVDLWALVASLYYMLTADYPRDFRKTGAIEAILKTMPVPIRERRPDLPESLAVLIDESLIDDAELPFSSAASLRDAYQGHLREAEAVSIPKMEYREEHREI
jgi:hypothetical protein